MSSGDRAVLTLATGKSLYVRLALNLARSFVYWHSDSDIRFYIATDQPCDVPHGLRNVSIIRLREGELPKGFSAKLHLDRLAPARRTLFVDADCLCCGPLDPVFARFEGCPVGVVGSSISSGEWFGDVSAVLRRFGLTRMPHFNGGVYYVEPGEAASGVYARARELEDNYDALGFVRLRGRPNDEVLVALAMALAGFEALRDDGDILGDPQACPGELEVRVLRGWSRLENPAFPAFQHQAWYPLHIIHPVLIHFLGDFTNSWPYRVETRKLELVFNRHWHPLAVDVTLSATVGTWCRTVVAWKDFMRPMYRRIRGTRPVAPSERAVG